MTDHKEIKSVSIFTLGCKSNQYDSAAIEGIVTSGGLQVVPYPAPADACIINTCTVTGKTDAEARQVIRKVRRRNPEALVIVTGCYAQVAPGEVAGVEGVDYVVGNPEKDRVLKYLKEGRAPGSGPVTDVGAGRSGAPLTLRAPSAAGRTRVNLKIQDGCDRACAYCIIPRARGASKSLAMDSVFCEIEGLIEKGFMEFVFTGIHLGGWGADLENSPGFEELLIELEKRDYPCRFRISSLDPDELTDGLIDILSSAGTICNHLHLPLQSGDDQVLQRMRRPYSAAHFARMVERVARRVDGISIGTDVIVGFPGEDEAAFEATRSLLRDLPISYTHIFPYSKRPGTLAASMAGHIDPREIKRRKKLLGKDDITKRADFYAGFTGKTARVLIESAPDRKTGLLKGRTRNYIPVLIEPSPDGAPADLGLMGREWPVLLQDASPEAMTGIIV